MNLPDLRDNTPESFRAARGILNGLVASFVLWSVAVLTWWWLR